MKTWVLMAALLVAGCCGVADTASAVTLFKSVTTFGTNRDPGQGWCSGCAGTRQTFDFFTLSSAISVNQIEFAAMDAPPYDGLAGVTIELWAVDVNNVLLNRLASTFVVPTVQKPLGHSVQLLAATSAIASSLDVGNYAISFYAPDLKLPHYEGGNGAMRQYLDPDNLSAGYVRLGGNLGYRFNNTLSAVPLPGALPLLLAGLLGLGAETLRRKCAGR